jgi:6-phosphogluconolactonase (cycloisomerase 2 family)
MLRRRSSAPPLDFCRVRIGRSIPAPLTNPSEAHVRSTILAAAIVTLVLLTLCPPLAAQSPRPTFLFLLEGKGTPIGAIHVFHVDASTGSLAEIPGSPFNSGFAPNQMVVDPTGRFLYVTNQQSHDITAFSVDASTGALTELQLPVAVGGLMPVTSAVDPTGRFLYVFATGSLNAVVGEYLFEYTIDDATGALTLTSSSPSLWEFQHGPYIGSIAFNPEGNFAYLVQSTGGTLGAPTLICSIDFSTGALTRIGAAQFDVQTGSAGQVNQIVVTPSGSLLYSINSPFNKLDAFTIGAPGAALAEISASPYTVPNNPSALLVYPAGNFLYVVNENQFYQPGNPPSQYDGEVSVFAFDSGTGVLAQVSGSPFAAGINPTSIVVDPTGSFAYVSATTYTGGNTSFAQILGFSINPSSGVLTPLASSPWTEATQFTIGAQVVIPPAAPGTSNPAPSISSLSPSSVTAGGPAFPLQVNGSNFVPGAKIYFGGQARHTTFVSATQLTAGILASDIDNDGTAVVFVFNPLPGGGASTSVPFPVPALVPVIAAIGPSSITANGKGFDLFVNGSNFVTSSVVNFNGNPLPTGYEIPTEIFGQVPGANVVAPGTASITVTTPANGLPNSGGVSNALTLTITPLVPPLSITSISPTSVAAGGPAFTLTIDGTGFVQNSQVSFNLNNVATTFVSSVQLTAAIPASAVAVAGNPYVMVTNPDGTSVRTTFTVNGNPQPGGGTVSAGANALTLIITGTGFISSSVVLVNGSPRPTTFESSTMLQATLSSSDLSQGGVLNISVMNPPPGGGTSGAIRFTAADYSVTAPASTISVSAGQTAQVSLTLSSTNAPFSYPVALSISQTPPEATAAFLPSGPITPGDKPQTVTLSIATMPHTAALGTGIPLGGPFILLPVLVGMILALAGLMLCEPDRGRRGVAAQGLLALLLVMLAGLAACGGVVSGTSPQPQPQPNPATGTPAGSYSITVTATSGGVSHSTTLTLTVM